MSKARAKVVATPQQGLKVSFDLPTTSNDYFLDHAPIVQTKGLHLGDHVHSFLHRSEHHVFVVEPVERRSPQDQARGHLTARETQIKQQHFYHSVLVVQMKNWEPLVFGPEFAIERVPVETETG